MNRKILDGPSWAHGLSRFSFGATSAIITSLALIVGLNDFRNPQQSIIGALAVLAVADNISDSLGIHVYRESDHQKDNARVYTFSNFFTRLAITSTFILMVLFLPLDYAIVFSLIFGLSLLVILSYLISVYQGTNPFKEILEHVGVAVIVIIASNYLGQAITHLLSM